MIVIHVIGPSFAGKSTYVKSNFPGDVHFDILQLYIDRPRYRDLDYLKQNYLSFKDEVAASLRQSITEVLQIYEESGKSVKKLLIVESSGTNKALNDYVNRLNTFTVFIVTPNKLILERFEQYRKDVRTGKAEERPTFKKSGRKRPLTTNIENFYFNYALGNIPHDTKYFTQLNYYYPPFSIAHLRQFRLGKMFEYFSKSHPE